jgi:hypothetical protein
LYRDTWIVFANPHPVPQTIRLVIRWDGASPVPLSSTLAVGGRWAIPIADYVPGGGNWNGTAEATCDPDGCPSTVSIYADNLKRGTVASHPAIEWECVSR